MLKLLPSLIQTKTRTNTRNKDNPHNQTDPKLITKKSKVLRTHSIKKSSSILIKEDFTLLFQPVTRPKLLLLAVFRFNCKV